MQFLRILSFFSKEVLRTEVKKDDDSRNKRFFTEKFTIYLK